MRLRSTSRRAVIERGSPGGFALPSTSNKPLPPLRLGHAARGRRRKPPFSPPCDPPVNEIPQSRRHDDKNVRPLPAREPSQHTQSRGRAKVNSFTLDQHHAVEIRRWQPAPTQLRLRPVGLQRRKMKPPGSIARQHPLHESITQPAFAIVKDHRVFHEFACFYIHPIRAAPHAAASHAPEWSMFPHRWARESARELTCFCAVDP